MKHDNRQEWSGDMLRRPHSANRPVNRTNRYGLVVAGALYATSTLGMAYESTARPVSAVSAADHLEPGLQGETIAGEAKDLPRPYAKGVRLVGKAAVPAGVGGTMAWSGHCAYVPGPSGVSVIDVHDPRAPSVVRVLTDKGAVDARETVDASGGILAASVYGQHGPGSRPGFDDPAKAWLAIYDVADCTSPRLLAEYKWPERAHTITVSSNGKRIYGTVIYPGTGHGGIQVLDIENPARPRFLGKFGVTRADGSTFEFSPHAITLSPDETRIYAGVISSTGGDLNRNLSSSAFPSVETFGPDAGGIYVLDNSEIAAGRTDPKIRLIGTARHAGWHSAVPARINGVPYLVGAGEMSACPGSWPRITSIADETKPVAVGEFRLQMNLKGNCPPRDEAETRSNGIVGRDGTAASHWNDVDSPTDTRLGLFPFTWAGLRIVDLREPARPIEVAYFKPGGNCMTHARYVRETGHIWFGCTGGGFYVIELQPELRASLGLPKPEGR